MSTTMLHCITLLTVFTMRVLAVKETSDSINVLNPIPGQNVQETNKVTVITGSVDGYSPTTASVQTSSAVEASTVTTPETGHNAHDEEFVSSQNGNEKIFQEGKNIYQEMYTVLPNYDNTLIEHLNGETMKKRKCKDEVAGNVNRLSPSSTIESDDQLLKKMFQSKFNVWDVAYLKEKINVRLVDKLWKPYGPSSQSEAVMDPYKWDVIVAMEALEKSTPYKYEEQPLPTADLLLTEDKFDQHFQNIIIIHQASDSSDTTFVRNTITALAMRNLHLVYNLFVIDISELNYQMFVTTINYYMRKPANFGTIAKTLGAFFVEASQKGKITPNKLHLIGFGFSAQLAGFMGRYIEEKTGVKIASILALDPIGSPNNLHVVPVNKDDAEVVHIYHTNSFPVGTVERRGTADFTFNDGVVQPQCRGEKNPWMCSHRAAAQLFSHVILYGGAQTRLFKARSCSSSIKFHFGDCNEQATALLSYPINEKNDRGSFFLKTSSVPRYGLGEEGCTTDLATRRKLLEYVEARKNTNEAPKVDRELFQMMLIT